ncbi:MAG: hypothetical protein M1371_09435 [Actinobacteria bacterium]|nr:hypothetical protein [Actinomycetota bacterium]
MDYILGVDGGGSKTIVQIADVAGNVLAENISNSTNYKSEGVKKATENLNRGMLSAISMLDISRNFTFKSACFGLSGLDSENDLKIYKRIVFNAKIKTYFDPKKTIICNDTKIGLAAGSNCKNKIILICGTGSKCFGVNENGGEAISNGWDYLADEGSGYEIGIKALRSLIKAYDRRGQNTLLSKTILEDLNLGGFLDLINWYYRNNLSKEKIAALAKTVCRTAEIGDEVSRRILAEEAEEAAISVYAVVNRLKIEDKKFDMVFAGNVFSCEKYFKNILVKKLKDRFKRISFVPVIKNPVEGAVKIAIENLNKDEKFEI